MTDLEKRNKKEAKEKEQNGIDRGEDRERGRILKNGEVENAVVNTND